VTFAFFFALLALLVIVAAGTSLAGALVALLFVLVALVAVWSRVRGVV